MAHLPKSLQIYITETGRAPFTEWFNTLKDKNTQRQVVKRVQRLSLGHFGDTRFIDEGINELRIHLGPGYRIYFAETVAALILLLCAGDKTSQRRDIQKAKNYWKEYRSTPS